MSYTIYGKIKYQGYNTLCSGVVGGGYVHPHFTHIDSASSASKWSNNVYDIDYTNEGYYSFDIEDQDLLDVTGNYRKGTDKFYIAYFWDSSNNSNVDKDSSSITYAAFISHTLEVGVDIKEINLTLLPVRLPIVDTNIFPESNLLTQHVYTMSETSHCDYTWEVVTSCGGIYNTEVSQKYDYDLVTIFNSYHIIDTIYSWEEIVPRQVSNSTSDDYTFLSSGDYLISMLISTAWNTSVLLEKNIRVRYNEPVVNFNWTPTYTNDWSGQKLKGQENITFHNTTTDLDNRSIPDYTYRWIIEDATYSGTDNTTTYSGTAHGYSPEHMFQSPGNKDVTLTCYWYDGFEDKEVAITKQLVIYPYDIIQDFNWDITPINRSEVVTFDSSVTTGDTFQINNYFWEVEDNFPSPIVDLYTFDNIEISKFSEGSPDNTQRVDNTLTYSGINYNILGTKFHSIETKNIYLEITYYNGWEDVEEHLTKQITPDKYNVNPIITASDFTPTGRAQTVTYINSTVDTESLQYTVDWVINDFYMECNLDNPTPGVVYNNTVTYSGVSSTLQPTHNYQNINGNNVDLTIRYDDGWQRQQKYITEITTPEVYITPVVNFNWLPSIPISRDVVVTFADNTTDVSNRHRKSDWEISDYFEMYNPNNPSYSVSNYDNFTTYSGVTRNYEPNHNFQSNVNHNVLLRYYYDDGFCEQFTEHQNTVTTTEYIIDAEFTMLPNASNQYGKNSVLFSNTTSDINNRSLDLEWTWYDRDGLNGDLDHTTVSGAQPVVLNQEFIWQYPSRRPFSCAAPGSTNVNKNTKLNVRYDNGWNDQSWNTVSHVSEAKTYEISTSITYNNVVYGTSEIWGQEFIRFTHNITDNWSAIYNFTTDWVIEDYNIDTSNNTLVLINVDKSTEPQHSFQSEGQRNVDVVIEFNDGWQNSYTNNVDIDITVKTYEVPLMNFNWLPTNPTVVDLVHFTQSHNDTRTNGHIDHVDVDFYANGVDLTVSGTEDFTNVFTPKQDNIPITLSGTYWDGFEFQKTSVTKYLDMSNIPPASDFTTTESGICVPSQSYFATSTDIDDDDSTLQYNWTLEYFDTDLVGWSIVGTGVNKQFDYNYQFEGQYKLTLKTTDQEGDFGLKQEEFNISFDSCNSTCSGTVCSGVGGGYVQLEEGWQLVSIPVKYGYWSSTINKHIHDGSTEAKFKNYILDQIDDKYGPDIIEVANTYLGDVQAFYSYVVGSTPESSFHNFKHVYEDSGYDEIAGFWIKVVGVSAPYVISWGET